MAEAASSSPASGAPSAPTTNTPAASPTANGAAPPASGPPSGAEGSTSPAPAAPKTWALKFGDRTEELTEEQLVHRAQKAYGAEQAFREAAEVRKQQAELKEAMKDPRKAREYIRKHNLGDPDAMLKTWALDWHQQQEMSPEQKEVLTERQRAEAAEAKLQAQEQAAAQAKWEADQQAAHGRFVESFSAALAKVVGPDVPPENVSPRLIQAMANWQNANLATAQGAPPEVVAQETIATAIGDGVAALHLFKSQPAALVKHLGPELVAAVINEVVRMEDERAGIVAPKPSRPQVVNGNGHDKARNPDGTFKPSGRESREAASFARFISGNGV